MTLKQDREQLQAGFGRVLIRPTLTVRFGVEDCSPPHESPRNFPNSVSVHYSLQNLPQVLGRTVKHLPPESVDAIPSGSLLVPGGTPLTY